MNSCVFRVSFLAGPLMVGLVLAVAAADTAGAEKPAAQADMPIYAQAGSLQQSLRNSRAAYREWLKQQPGARKTVSFGPWLATRPLSAAEADRLVRPAEGIDPDARFADGQPVWAPRETLVDGKAVPLGTGPADTSVYLSRTVRATDKTQLTVGLGGGDRLDVWLRGKKITTACTHLTSGRYGCSYRVDGTRVDQVLVDLDLQAGENELLIRLVPSTEPSFYFSASPRPLPRLWERIRRDFPPAQNPLLDFVHADWFAEKGWFAAEDNHWEQQFLARMVAADSEAGAGKESPGGSTAGPSPVGPLPLFEGAGCGKDRLAIREEVDRLCERKAGLDDPGWLDLCVKASVLARLRTDLARLRAAVEELGRSQAAEYPRREQIARLEDYDRRLSERARTRLDPADEATDRLMEEITRMQREMLVDLNPLLRDSELLFVKRYTYNSKHYYDDFLHISRLGGNLCVLSLADGSLRQVVPELAEGIFDRYDLSFDAERIVFGYRRSQPEGFRIYEIGTDGSGLRQVTHPPADEPQRIAKYGQSSVGDSWYGSMGFQFWTDDLHPCYLPDGGICFASTRCEHGVLCTPAHYLACTTLHRVDADGSGLRPLSQGALSEFTPTMMQDGRILYNRWEYVYKGIGAVQSLWLMRPDGSGSEEFYGDNVANPGVMWQARQVPGHSRLAVCTGCGHEPLGVGQLLLLNLNKNKRTPEPMVSLTPEVKTQGLRGLYQFRNGVWREDIYGPLYADPYPLSDKFFLVSCNPAGRYNDEAAYGIYLIDVFGNRVPIYCDEGISCWQPMPLRPRTRPPVLPSVAHQVKSGKPVPVVHNGPDEAAGAVGKPACNPSDQAKATVFLSDVYRGLDGVEPGTVKYLRVMEQIAKPWAAEIDPLRGEDRKADGFGGHIVVSKNAHIWIAVLHGIVPVEEDGSACFEVPAGRNLFFQALDEDFMEVQRMRTFLNFEPGEKRSCIGCHEQRTQAPVSRLATAFGQAPAALVAQPGETAPRPLHYPSDVQPILDRRCVGCHNGEDPQAQPDLRGDLTRLFNRSYESIFEAGLIDTIQEWAGASYSMQNAEAVPPYTYGSHRSRLVELLQKDHHEVKLSREEWIKLVTWIDCGAPYYGSYYGRRNLVYQGQPDFRPVPTVASACGIPPEFHQLAELDPLPAELLAWWPFDEDREGTTPDVSGNDRHAQVVGATWTGDQPDGRELMLDGSGRLAAGGLGRQKSISVSLWVKPSRTPNRWNPLLFTDGRDEGAFHMSLLEDGTPNVAINRGEGQWTHRQASTSLGTGRWRHLVVTCDPRFGGSIVFYVDGKRDSQRGLALNVPLNLDAFHVGNWNSWAQTPGRGFQGAMSELKVYRGTLSEEQVADLFTVATLKEPEK